MAGKATVSAKITADTKNWNVHMAQAAKAADNVRKSSARLDKQNSAMARTFQRAAAGASVLHGPLNGLSGRLNAIATAMRLTHVGVVALGGAFTALGVGLAAGIKSMADFEVQMKRVQAVQEATGYAAGFTGQQIHDMAQELAMSTLASVDGVMAAAAALGTFGSIAGENFEKTLTLAQDVAEAMGTDMQGATIQLAKALENPEQGLTALTRAGVTFTEGTKSQIEAALEFGDILKAQGIILEQVEDQLGGVGKAVADDTLLGGWDTLTQHIQKFLRQNEGVIQVLGLIKSGLNGINQALGDYNAGEDDIERAWRRRQEAVAAYNKALKGPLSGFKKVRDEARAARDRADTEYWDVLKARQAEAIENEKARQDGIAQQQKTAEEARLAAKEKYMARHQVIDNKYAVERAKLEKRASTVKWDQDNPSGSANQAL